MSTIREHIEALLSRHVDDDTGRNLCDCCRDEPMPCPSRTELLILRDELSRAKRTYNLTAGELADWDMRMVYDPHKADPPEKWEHAIDCDMGEDCTCA